jgi:LPXTG-site transpeptidase (sortase) family protein
MWIPFLSPRHRARLDENGNIILPSDEPAPLHEEPLRRDPDFTEDDEAVMQREETEDVSTVSLNPAWIIEEPPAPEEIMDTAEEATTATEEKIGRAPYAPIARHLTTVRTSITEDVLREGLRQYRVSIASAVPMFREIGEGTRWGLRRVQNFLTQPVWVPGRRNRVKQVSRGTLFIQDIVRFGATFAGIFALLFVTLNYQSFWQITSAQLMPFLTSPAIDSQNDDVAAKLQANLKLLPGLATAGAGVEGDLLSYLPPVGPPDNRLIIPQLDLNVPLVNPSYDSLLKGDWPQVEKDIQAALVDGVVHYPGTANPGQAGNFFVTGHSSYYPWAPGNYKTVFARLSALSVGDEYWVYSNGDKYRYVVRSKKEVSPSDITVLDQPVDERISTLMTCTPVGTTLRRLIIVADEVDPTTGTIMKVGERPTQQAPKLNLESLPI